MELDPKLKQLYERLGLPLPTRDPHGTPDDIRANMQRAECKNWRLVGNELTADTQFGPFTQRISTDYILVGEKDGLPMLKKVPESA